MGASFALGSAIPIVAFILPVAMRVSAILALIFATAGLFAIGYYAGTLTNRSNWSKALEVVAYGAAVFALSYLAGRYIPPLFGHAPVSVGG